jgi:hypothetical protein
MKWTDLKIITGSCSTRLNWYDKMKGYFSEKPLPGSVCRTISPTPGGKGSGRAGIIKKVTVQHMKIYRKGRRKIADSARAGLSSRQTAFYL